MARPAATLSRGNTSVDIPLIEQSGTLSVARDVGSPTLAFDDVGREDPRFSEYLNYSDAFTVRGILEGSNAYSDAQTLAEDLVKARATTGTPLQLDLSDLPNLSTYDVGVANSGALRLGYRPGRVDMVGVNLTVSRVSQTAGGPQNTRDTISPDSSAATGVKLDSSDGNTSVTISSNLSVTRKVGRPNANLRPFPDRFPRLVDQNDPAQDEFEVSGELLSNADTDANTLETTIVGKRLGQDPLRLHFLDNLWGLDAYDVVPAGTQALRTVRNTGETGVVDVPTLTLRVVDNTS